MKIEYCKPMDGVIIAGVNKRFIQPVAAAWLDCGSTNCIQLVEPQQQRS